MFKLVIGLLAIFSCAYMHDAFEVQSRIVNGDAVLHEDQFPYYVFLKTEGDRNAVQKCGASLISDEWILTAGHCLHKMHGFLMILGLSEINIKEVTMGDSVFQMRPNDQIEKLGRFIRVERKNVHIHPGYVSVWDSNLSASKKEHDIGLIRLPRKVNFSHKIQPVRLPTTCNRPEIVDAILVGFGTLNNSLSLNENKKLMFSEMRTLPAHVCQQHFPFISGDMFFCAKSEQLKVSERGDSGGPLVTMDGTLIGITVMGNPATKSDGFTNIFAYFDWIRNVTGLSLPEC